jgi:hypothetical protein
MICCGTCVDRGVGTLEGHPPEFDTSNRNSIVAITIFITDWGKSDILICCGTCVDRGVGTHPGMRPPPAGGPRPRRASPWSWLPRATGWRPGPPPCSQSPSTPAAGPTRARRCVRPRRALPQLCTFTHVHALMHAQSLHACIGREHQPADLDQPTNQLVAGAVRAQLPRVAGPPWHAAGAAGRTHQAAAARKGARTGWVGWAVSRTWCCSVGQLAARLAIRLAIWVVP